MKKQYYITECVNRNCSNIFFVLKYQLQHCLQCDKCTNKK